MSTWIRVGTVNDIPRQGARVIRYDDTDIAVFRTVDDELFALRNACAHKQGPIADGIVHGCQVTCPLHNWVFDLQSGDAVGPDEGAIPSYPVRVSEGLIELKVSRPGDATITSQAKRCDPHPSPCEPVETST